MKEKCVGVQSFGDELLVSFGNAWRGFMFLDRSMCIGPNWVSRILLAAVLAGAALMPAQADALADPPDPATAGSAHLWSSGVLSAATATILAPSAEDGDFGASLGNVWDMDSVADIVIVPDRVWLEKSPVPGTIVRGHAPRVAYAVWPIGFYDSPTVPIPTSKYHHMIYRLRIAAEGTCETNGLIALSRTSTSSPAFSILYSNGFLPQIPPMNCPFGEFGIYYVDLATNQNGSLCPTWTGSPSPSSPSPWLGTVRAFGIAPHEYWWPPTCAPGASGGPEYYDLDFVYLTGEIVAREQDGYKYTARWNVANPAGVTVTSTMRYMQVDELRLPSLSPACTRSDFHPDNPPPPPPGLDHTLFMPLALKTGSDGRWSNFASVVRTTTNVQGTSEQNYVLDFSDSYRFADGKSYYLCIEVDDGTSQSYVVSSAPVIRVPLSPRFGGCGLKTEATGQ
jgi:hypothetical protein